MMKRTMASGNVLTESCERKRFLRSSTNAGDLDSPSITDHLSPITSIGGAVSSVVEHYLDTVGVTGSNPVSRTICNPFENSDYIIMSAPASERSTLERHISVWRRLISNFFSSIP